ncbi:hypothetical protein [Jannaschia seohaensis]|uniref:Uncharacterized protein n=1 Tax=Jannaschia seohaensis TaxID=475081 RepID=A0A2Y9C7I8_9RHOB|nr:hypothetical protein [Jannaschia seohaensis]PWJ19109.1 hypothetical protein BCF38_10438 [Jannaschia seohaensis]SSA45743.1 hypothetical protein SAMN05421539_10438 [Jannaschia seohaensis]
MLEQALTQTHRARLEAEIERARLAAKEATAHARETGAKMPPREEDDAEMQLYHKAGRAAFFFCIWFAMVSPIILFITLWD